MRQAASGGFLRRLPSDQSTIHTLLKFSKYLETFFSTGQTEFTPPPTSICSTGLNGPWVHHSSLETCSVSSKHKGLPHKFSLPKNRALVARGKNLGASSCLGKQERKKIAHRQCLFKCRIPSANTCMFVVGVLGRVLKLVFIIHYLLLYFIYLFIYLSIYYYLLLFIFGPVLNRVFIKAFSQTIIYVLFSFIFIQICLVVSTEISIGIGPYHTPP